MPELKVSPRELTIISVALNLLKYEISPKSEKGFSQMASIVVEAAEVTENGEDSEVVQLVDDVLAKIRTEA